MFIVLILRGFYLVRPDTPSEGYRMLPQWGVLVIGPMVADDGRGFLGCGGFFGPFCGGKSTRNTIKR